MLAYRGTMDQTPSARRPGRQRQNTAYSASSTCPRPAGARRERGTGRTTSWPERRRVLGKCPLFNSTSRKNKAISFLRLAPWFTMEKKKTWKTSMFEGTPPVALAFGRGLLWALCGRGKWDTSGHCALHHPAASSVTDLATSVEIHQKTRRKVASVF